MLRNFADRVLANLVGAKFATFYTLFPGQLANN
jgi:hypothetical protein